MRRYNKNRTRKQGTYISTLSTLTPQGSVASSRVCSITWEMVSRSDRISAKCFVPRTFRNVVAASKCVEWLKSYVNATLELRKWSKEEEEKKWCIGIFFILCKLENSLIFFHISYNPSYRNLLKRKFHTV